MCIFMVVCVVCACVCLCVHVSAACERVEMRATFVQQHETSQLSMHGFSRYFGFYYFLKVSRDFMKI